MIRQFAANLTSGSDVSKRRKKMLKKITAMMVFVLVLNLAITPYAFASDNPVRDAKLVEKVKTGIAKLGTGPEAKVEIKLKVGTKLKGYVTEISDEKFVVMDSRTGQTVPVLYSTVKQVKGNNLSKGAIITIGFVAFFVLLFVILHVQRQNT